MADSARSAAKVSPVSPLKIAVLGVGAVGGLLASEWAACGLTPTLLLQDAAKLQRYRHAGTLRVEHQNKVQLWPLPAELVTESGPEWDVVLLCTKAWASATAVTSIAPRIDPSTTIVLLGNGLGVEESVRAVLSVPVQLMLGSTTQGAYRREEFTICHAGLGNTTLGGAERPPDWFSAARARGLPWQWEPDIATVLWRKLLINCAINPLAALYGCRNGELLNRAAYRSTVNTLVEELLQVARLRAPDISATLAKDIYAVIQGTAENRCSMLQDLTAGRRTERDYILGYLLNFARSKSLELPLCAELYARLGEAERSALPQRELR